MVSTDCSGEKQEIAPTFRMSKNIAALDPQAAAVVG